MQISKTQFKAQLEELLNKIQTENEEVIIVDDGENTQYHFTDLINCQSHEITVH